MKSKNTYFLNTISIFALGILSLATAAPKQPNLIVFLVDDMGLMDSSVPFLTDGKGLPKRYPLNDWYQTPNMKRLADRGIRFNNFYAQSVCSPTRACIMTGQNATRNGTTQWINPMVNNRGKFGPPKWNWKGLTKKDVTLPRVLQSHGYRTIHVGKAHFGPMESEGSNPLNLGFDVNIGGASWGRPLTYYGKNWYGNHPKYKGKNGKKKVLRNIPGLEKYHGTDTYLTEALTLEAKSAIDQAVKDEKPFYLYMAHYAVHAPFEPDPRFADHYKNKGKSKLAQAYATMIEGIDKSLGDLMDELEKRGVAENTLILFLGDNGSDAPLGNATEHTSSAPLRGKKGTLFEGGMRVAFIAAWAKPNPENPFQKALPIPQGALQGQMGTVMDIYPTLLAVSQSTNPPKHIVDGYDLRTQLLGKNNPNRSKAFLMHFPHSHRSSYFTSYCTKDWKLVYHYNPKTPDHPTYELYDLKNDPFENSNIANQKPEKLRSLVKAMSQQLQDEHALYPVDKNGNELKPKMP
jgi:arylsulfatase A-like enzyme